MRETGTTGWGPGLWSSFKDWARNQDVDELLSEFAMAHVEGSATVAADARDDLSEKRHQVMQRWVDRIAKLQMVFGDEEHGGTEPRPARVLNVQDVEARDACVEPEPLNPKKG